MAKSTLSNWLHGIELSEEQQQRIKSRVREAITTRRFNLPEFNRRNRQQQITKIRIQAKRDIGRLSAREFLIAGAMLYWAEGNKQDGVQISNADPLFIQFMMQWFRQAIALSDDRFTGAIHYHEGQNEYLIKEFWSELTGIPKERFIKSFKKPPGTGHRTHYLQWGVCRIRVTRSADLFHQIAGWKDGLIENIISGKSRVRP